MDLDQPRVVLVDSFLDSLLPQTVDPANPRAVRGRPNQLRIGFAFFGNPKHRVDELIQFFKVFGLGPESPRSDGVGFVIAMIISSYPT